MAVVDRVRAIVEPLVDAADLQLYDIEHHGGTLRVLVEGPDGLNLDEITSLSRAIGRALDDEDPLPGRYTLEVSSPGLERPLRTAAHFRGAVGLDVKVKMHPGFNGPRRIAGVLVEADEHGIRLRADDGSTTALDLADITSARTVFHWGPGPKPSGPGQRSDDPDSTPTDSDREATSS